MTARTDHPPRCTGHDARGTQCVFRVGHEPPCRFHHELLGASQNAELVHRIAHPRSADDLLATAILLLVQYLEKRPP